MPFSRFLGLLTAGLLTTALAGCNCNSRTCDCFSETEDDITLKFDTDSLNGGFRRADIRSAYVVRYERPGFTTPLDTFRQQPSESQYFNFYSYQQAAVTLNPLFNSRPEAPDGRLMDYNYRVLVPAAAKQYDVSEVHLDGEVRGDECCHCYHSTQKSIRLDGTYFTTDRPNRQLDAVLRR